MSIVYKKKEMENFRYDRNEALTLTMWYASANCSVTPIHAHELMTGRVYNSLAAGCICAYDFSV